MKKVSISAALALSLIISVGMSIPKPAAADSVPIPQIHIPNYTQTTDTIDITTFPQFPSPGDTVKATLTSTLSDLTRTDVSWTIDGKTVEEGVGVTSITFTAGSIGKTDTISVKAVNDNGDVLTKSITLTPASVDLIWQAHSYVPPFYKGKALFPYQGEVTVAAIADFGGATSRNYVYTWNINNSADPDDSGYQKDSITLTGGVLMRPIDVTVTVSNFDGTITGTGETEIVGITPTSLLYENNPLYGILFNRSLSGGFSLKEQEVGLITEPFYFSADSADTPDVGYEWDLNDTTVSDNTAENSLTLRAPANSSGASTISVKTISPDEMLQSVTTNTTINFSKS